MKKIIITIFFISDIILFFSCKKEQGPAGAKSLVNLIPINAGGDCANGGVKIETGVDLNGNNILDSSEVTDTQSLCNGTAGTNGYSSLIRTSSFSANTICENGGLQVETGIDSNFNGILDSEEVQQTQQICNGLNGTYNKQVAIVLSLNGYGTDQTVPYVYTTTSVNFNINNFPNVDSAVLYVGNMKVYNTGDVFNVKLYNITDNIPFDKSLVSTNSLQPVNLTSNNFVNDFPAKSINLGIQAYVNKAGAYGDAGYFYLVLYRK